MKAPAKSPISVLVLASSKYLISPSTSSPSAIFFALFINLFNGFTTILEANNIITADINIYDILIIRIAIFPLCITCSKTWASFANEPK